MPFQQNPPLTRALAVSLLLHAVLLLGVKGNLLPDPAVPAPPLVAFLVAAPEEKAQPSAPAAAVTAPAPAQVKRVRPEPPPRSKKAERKITVAESHAPKTPLHPVLEPASEPASKSVSEPEPTGVPNDSPHPPVPAGSAPVTKPADGKAGAAAGSRHAGDAAAGQKSFGQEGMRADDIRTYKAMLETQTKRFKRYPPLARERGWEGTVKVVLDFQRHLPEPAVYVGGSSSRSMLDDQALEMVRRAVQSVSMPERLQKQDFRISLSVRFDLLD